MQARIALGAAAVAAAAVFATTAIATAPPIGPLPASPTQHITTQVGQLVAVALPNGTDGRAWRLAGPLDPNVLREVSEANVGPTVVIVFRAYGKGTVTLAYGLTRGETSKAFAAHRFSVVVK